MTMLGIFSRPKTVSNVDADEFQRIRTAEKNVVLIDVRTHREFAAAHIPGALHIDVQSQGFKERVSSLDKHQPVLLYCRSGRRSMAACRMMAEQGFQELYNLKGGMLQWHFDTKTA